MTRLFLIHSFATYHCALGIVRKEGFKPSDCVFVTYRHFVCRGLPMGIQTAELTCIGKPNLCSIRTILRGRRELRSRDQEVSRITFDRDFHCYAPHTYFDYANLIVTHPRCTGFSYIEEGLTSYYRPGEIDSAYPPWKFTGRSRAARAVFFGKRLTSEVAFFRSDYRTAYGFAEESFPGWPRRTILGTDELFSISSDARVCRPPVLIFDALVELNRTSAKALGEAIGSFLAYCVRAGISELQYKFHPSQHGQPSVALIREIFHSFSPELSIRELAPELCLENLFAEFRMTVYVFNSASGLYAALAGQDVYSLNPILAKIDPDYGATIHALPSIYHQLVKPIDLSRVGDH